MLLRATLLATIMFALSAQTASTDKYRAGQVWEYHARPQDAGSLLKIQKVERQGLRRVYHISISDVHVGATDHAQLQHSPVSDKTLDASVTRLAPESTPFPSVNFEEGIAAWRAAHGGVFTITVGEIVEIIDVQVRHAQ